MIDALLATPARGRLVREGAQVAIVGRPNAGKSSLFNPLAGAGRAIVTDMPGTTRDLLTETIDLDGIAVTLVDTAGLRASRGRRGRSGRHRARARRAAGVADLIVVVLDRSAPLTADDDELLVDDGTERAASWCEQGRSAACVGSAARAARRRCRCRRARAPASTRCARRWSARLVGRRAACATRRRSPTAARRAAVERARAALARARGRGGGRARRRNSCWPTSARRARLLEEITGRADAGRCAARDLRQFCIGK